MRLYQTDIVVNTNAIATPNTAELAVASSSKISTLPAPGQSAPANPIAHVRGNVCITPGTAAVAIVIKVYRGGSVAGVLIGTITIFCVATDPIQASIDALDPTPGATPQYTMSVAQTSGSAAGSVTLSALQTDILAA